MLLFRDEEHVDRWCAARELQHGAILPAEQAWQLAAKWFHNRLTPEWRRFTLDEAQDILTSVGLTGDFWNLRS